jgi:glyoxylase-like metal-dependent hydrolase (beta-lactamase superfamily II)/rhodanese-related sulfurtransferase
VSFARDHLIPLTDEGLGNSAYLADLGGGRALAVDASRDLRALRQAAARRGLSVAFAADTHLHADFLTGSVQLAAGEGAVVLASAAGRREFPHTPLADGDEVDLGGLRLRALATPGHTDEHLSYLLLDGSRELGVFTGGSLIVGSVARTDLLGACRAEELARAQYRSLRRLAALPGATAVWPTHGAGSFCSAPPGAARTTTIGAEKAENPLLGAPNEDAFVKLLLAGLGSYPPYFLRMREINRRGPAVFGPKLPVLASLGVDRVRWLVDDGAVVVDVRPVEDFGSGHVPGSLSIPLRDQFATWLGWLVENGRPIIFVLDSDQDRDELVRQALKVGYEHLLGELVGGMAAWNAAGLESRRIPLVRAAEAAGTIIDIRQNAEFAAGHIPGAQHIELGSVVDADIREQGPLTLMCGHGERAMSGASLLSRTGRRQLAVLVGGPAEWAHASGSRLALGP